VVDGRCQRDTWRRLALGGDVGGPVIAIAATLAKVEGCDCALGYQPDENKDHAERELGDQDAHWEDPTHDAQGKRRAEHVEGAAGPRLADHPEADAQRSHRRPCCVRQCRSDEREREIHADEHHTEGHREPGWRLAGLESTPSEREHRSEHEERNHDPAKKTERDEPTREGDY